MAGYKYMRYMTEIAAWLVSTQLNQIFAAEDR